MNINTLIIQNSNVVKFLKDLRKHSEKFNINLQLENKPYLNLSENIKCAGYFEEDTETLAVAMQHNDWLSTILHESCHMDQYLEQDSIWQLKDSIVDIEEYISNPNYSQDITKHVKNCIRLELDCEKRTVEKIKYYDLPINIHDYIKKANAYICFYGFLKHSVSHGNNLSISYTNAELLKLMPSEFKSLRYYNSLNNKIISKFIEEKFGKDKN